MKQHLVAALRRFGPPLLVLGGGVFAGWFFLVRSPEVGSLSEHLSDRGKVLVVGDPGVDAPGTTLVPASGDEEIERLLGGRDEKALARACKRRGYRAILAESGRIDLALLPRSTLGNALAAGTPLSRFTAVALADGATLWEIHEPFDVRRDAARALVSIARSVLAGDDPPDPDRVPGFLTSPRGAEVAVVVRRQGPAIIWRSAKRGSLYESVVEGAKVLRDRWRVRQRRRFGQLETALARMTIEIHVFHDQGLLVTRSRELALRVIEPGIFGATIQKGTSYRYLLPPEATYRSHHHAIQFLEAVSKEADLEPEGWMRPDVKLWRFRTIHWRETAPGGPIVRLERGIPPVGEEVLTRRGLVEVLDGATHWLAANQLEDGQYRYKYYPIKDQWIEQRKTTVTQNVVRHALAAYGTLLAYEFVAKDEYLEAAKDAVGFLRVNTKRGVGPPGRGDSRGPADVWEGKRIPDDMAWIEWVDNEDVGTTAKAATVSAMVLALTQLAALTDSTPDLREEIDSYGKFLLFLQKEDGSFHHYFVASGHDYHGEEHSIFPGEILFAISRAYRVTGDRRYRDAFARGAAHYEEWYRDRIEDKGWNGEYSDATRGELVQFVPWISMAMNDMYQQERNRGWAEFGIHGAEWIVREYQWGRSRAFYPDYLGAFFAARMQLPAMHGIVYTEGTASGYNLARLTNQRERRETLRRATLLGCRFAAQQLVRPGVNDFYLRNPAPAAGGIRFGLTDNHLRTDYTYHTLSAVYQALRFMPREDLPE